MVIGPTAGPAELALSRRDIPKITLTLPAYHVELVSDDAAYEEAARLARIAEYGEEGARQLAENLAHGERLRQEQAHRDEHTGSELPPPHQAHLNLDEDDHEEVHRG